MLVRIPGEGLLKRSLGEYLYSCGYPLVRKYVTARQVLLACVRLVLPRFLLSRFSAKLPYDSP